MIVEYNLRKQKCTRICGVQFGLMKSKEIEKMSVCEVKDVNIYHRGVPQAHGINDTRMGTVDRRIMCSTCGNDVQRCTGHIGHIKLCIPCYNIGFFDTVLKILRTVCFACSRVTVNEGETNDSDEHNKTSFAAVYGMARSKKTCPHCGFPKANYTRLALNLKIEWPSNVVFESEAEEEFARRPFTSLSAYSILDNITDKESWLMGFDPTMSHPRDMMISALLVPPPISRPAIMASEGSRSRGQDDLTHKLQDVNKKNNELRAHLASLNISMDSYPTLQSDTIERIAKLQYEVFAFMNNNIRGQRQSTQRSGAPFKSVADRLKGKDGRVRGNLMGKRVNFSGRSVISPDPIMDVDEIGVPYSIACCLTIQEKVQPHNIADLTARVHNGPTDVLGAETLIDDTGECIQLSSCANRESLRLKYGMTVERYIRNGDYVVFNRQPSLHRMGMLGHRVVLMPGLTFRLNLSCNNPYNADFDGDEMNVHVIQSPIARAEVQHIMAVQHQIISPQASKPVMGIVQDALLGAYLLTHEICFMKEDVFSKLMTWIKYPAKNLDIPEPTVLFPEKLWTGHQLFALLFPCDFCLTRWKRSTQIPVDELHISSGCLHFGVMNKQNLGSSSGGIVDALVRDYNTTIAVNFMTNEQRMIMNWLMDEGFSIGIRDCVISDVAENDIRTTLHSAVKNIDEISRDVTDELLQGVSESTKVQILSRMLMKTATTVNNGVIKHNAIQTTIHAGSKGNPVNLCQVCGCVGQQSVEGQRLRAEKGHRTLPCFSHGEESVNVHGMVQNSYALGLKPDEFFFHAMGGREGLVDTAVKTATTGYIQRRQMKAMEDNKVHYDNTVRAGNSFILDFSYGGDNMDSVKLEKLKLTCLSFSDEQLRRALVPDITDSVDYELQYKQLRALVIELRRVRFTHYDGIDKTILLPINIERTKNNMLRCDDEDVDTGFYRTELQNCIDNCEQICGQKVMCLHAYLLFHLNCKAMKETRCSRASFSKICAHIVNRYINSMCPAGEGVGSVAAQSVGEPCTQMTLNTFHFAGCGSKNVTLGIPRLKEILDNSRCIRTPCKTFRIRETFEDNKVFAELLAQSLKHCSLKDIVAQYDVIYDPDPMSTVINDDKDLVKVHNVLFRSQKGFSSDYIARICLDKRRMKSLNVTPEDIASIISSKTPLVDVIYSPVNSFHWMLRLRFRDVRMMMERVEEEVRSRTEEIFVHCLSGKLFDAVTISGIVGVYDASVRMVDTWDEKTQQIKSPYCIDVMGGSLVDMSCVDSVDWYSAHSNDVHEVNELLGIEAAYSVLFKELMTTLLFDGGTYINPRHVTMIVNTMTSRGYIMPLSRHGINRMDNSPLVRCSFEETIDTLCDAAIYSEVDDAEGVTQNIMTGQTARIGTGIFDILDSASMNTPKKSIAKSHVRCTARPADMNTSVEYINPSTWIWNGPRENNVTHMPFDAVHKESLSVPAPGAVEKPYTESEKKSISCHMNAKRRKYYTPSSPPTILK